MRNPLLANHRKRIYVRARDVERLKDTLAGSEMPPDVSFFNRTDQYQEEVQGEDSKTEPSRGKLEHQGTIQH